MTKSSLDQFGFVHYNLLFKAIAIAKESELDSWENAKKLQRTTFISNLLEFEARNITSKIRKKLESNGYLGEDGVDEAEQLIIANVSETKHVAGCLIQWIEAQLQCNKFLPKVEPELARLNELKSDLASICGRPEN